MIRCISSLRALVIYVLVITRHRFSYSMLNFISYTTNVPKSRASQYYYYFIDKNLWVESEDGTRTPPPTCLLHSSSHGLRRTPTTLQLTTFCISVPIGLICTGLKSFNFATVLGEPENEAGKA